MAYEEFPGIFENKIDPSRSMEVYSATGLFGGMGYRADSPKKRLDWDIEVQETTEIAQKVFSTDERGSSLDLSKLKVGGPPNFYCFIDSIGKSKILITFVDPDSEEVHRFREHDSPLFFIPRLYERDVFFINIKGFLELFEYFTLDNVEIKKIKLIKNIQDDANLQYVRTYKNRDEIVEDGWKIIKSKDLPFFQIEITFKLT